jgi:hypothetical protein
MSDMLYVQSGGWYGMGMLFDGLLTEEQKQALERLSEDNDGTPMHVLIRNILVKHRYNPDNDEFRARPVYRIDD